MDNDDGINVDILAVGLIRPSTFLGVPYGAAVFNLLLSVEALALTENLIWLLLCVPLHGICYLVTLKDPRSFELILLWSKSSLATLISSRAYWQVSTYGPLTSRTSRKIFEEKRISRRHNHGDLI